MVFKRIRFAIFPLLLLASCREKTDTLFSNLSSSQTHINFTNTPAQGKLLNILYYLYYYNGGGVAAGDINNDGLIDLYFSANSHGNNKLYLNKGNFQFEDITASSGTAGNADWCTGVTMADVNGDGLLDIYVCAIANAHGLKGKNELFINQGNATFKEAAAEYGLDFAGFSTQAAFFDYDHDGDLDCYLLNQSQRPHANINDTSFRRKTDSLAGDRLLRNELTAGLLKFTDVSVAAGILQSPLGYGLGIAVADLNHDGWDDLYISNDFHENDYYYVNNGNGSFSEQGAGHFRHYSRFSMGNDIADYNNDGQPDIITVDMLPPDEKTLKTYGSDENKDIYTQKISSNGYQDQYSRNCLQMNNGNGSSFSDIALMAGISATDWSWSPLFADFDNDGNKDLFVSSGIVKRPVDLDYVRFISDLYQKKQVDATDAYDDMAIEKMPDGASHPFLFKGNGKDGFTDESKNWGTAAMKGYFNGAAYADLDNDGDLDLVINAIDAKATVLRNNSKAKHYLDIEADGEGANTAGVGLKAWLFAGGHMQYQQLMLTRGFQSSVAPRLHFGLDSITTIDSLLLVWPDGRYEVKKNLSGDTLLRADQKNTNANFAYADYFVSPPPDWEDISHTVTCNWQHRENRFTDFNVQYLIPHEQSTRGPKLAVSDVNGDGLDDFYVCGATGQAGALMIQDRNGNFSAQDTGVFNKAAAFEEVNAIFFDANKDGFDDLYVVSGGNQRPDNDSLLGDHLYLNDGRGHFREAPGRIPVPFVNKTSACAADIDNDGDKDLFVSGFASSTAYGYAQPSYLFINDGTGYFRQADSTVIALQNAGMITSSSFIDINNDNFPELLVAGEWMPVTIYSNNNGKFTKTTVPHSSGIWQSVFVTDVNADGRQDILAGNWGHNTKLWSGKNGPCKLYVKDFDQNGSVEQILCYTIDGEEYPFLAKDELERRLPTLKKGYLTYSEVAGKNVQYILYNLFEGNTALEAEVLGSSVFINEGNGQFTRKDLAGGLQTAPIFSFAPVTPYAAVNYLAAGNFYGVIPYEGRYDALQPTFFGFANNQSTVWNQLPVAGEIRDAKWIQTAKWPVLVMARNNGKLVFYKSNTKH